MTSSSSSFFALGWDFSRENEKCRVWVTVCKHKTQAIEPINRFGRIFYIISISYIIVGIIQYIKFPIKFALQSTGFSKYLFKPRGKAIFPLASNEPHTAPQRQRHTLWLIHLTFIWSCKKSVRPAPREWGEEIDLLFLLRTSVHGLARPDFIIVYIRARFLFFDERLCRSRDIATSRNEIEFERHTEEQKNLDDLARKIIEYGFVHNFQVDKWKWGFGFASEWLIGLDEIDGSTVRSMDNAYLHNFCVRRRGLNLLVSVLQTKNNKWARA